jgi:hypothetical protein
MLSFVFTLALAASPRELPAAEPVLFVPRLDKLSELAPFFRTASRDSALFRVEGWRNEFYPLLDVNAFEPESLRAAGLDPKGSATLSFLGAGRVTCTSLSDVARFEEKSGEKLAGFGTPWKGSSEGAKLVGALRGKTVVAGYALKGKEACTAISDGESMEPVLQQAAKVLAGKARPARNWKAVQSFPGAVYLASARGALALRGDAGPQLVAEGTMERPGQLPALAAASKSPYGALKPSGLAFARAQVSRDAAGDVARLVTRQVSMLCAQCDGAALEAITAKLAPLLTGNVLLRVDKARVRQSLRRMSARYFAVRHAYLAELERPEEARKALESLATWSVATPFSSVAQSDVPDGFALKVEGGELYVGVRGAHLYFGNDAGAVKVAAALPADEPAPQAHSAELYVDPSLVAKGLEQINLLDAVGAPELAGLFAAGLELGPLLSHSEQLWLWADPSSGNSQRFRAAWRLRSVQ